MFKVNVVVVNPKRARAVSHGVAEEGSPRREPWGKTPHRQKPRQGRQNCGQRELSFAASRLRLSIPQPTADAVGYLPSLLRSYLPAFSRTDLRPGETRGEPHWNQKCWVFRL